MTEILLYGLATIGAVCVVCFAFVVILVGRDILKSSNCLRR